MQEEPPGQWLNQLHHTDVSGVEEEWTGYISALGWSIDDIKRRL